MEYTSGAYNATAENSAEKTHSSAVALPEFPGEDVLAHEGAVWIEQAEARFGPLLAVAQGQPPAGGD